MSTISSASTTALAIWPATGLDHAAVLAERIRAAVEGHVFATGVTHTISAGLAELLPGEAADTILARVDQGLYLAKDGGRNRVAAA